MGDVTRRGILKAIAGAAVLGGATSGAHAPTGGGGGGPTGGGFIDAQVVLRPHPGPQTDFLASTADMVLGGGAGGGGKSWALIYAGVLHGVRTPGWTGLICRSKAVDLLKPGGLWDRAQEIARQTGGHARGGQYRDIHWPGGGRLAFDYVAKGNYQNYRSTELAFLGFDEVNECPMEAVIFLMSRLRTTCGAKPILRMTCNPDPTHEIAKWVDPYYLIDGGEEDGRADRAQSGKIRYFARRAKDDAFIFGETPEATADEAEREVWEVKSFTFVPSLLDDNPTLAGNETQRRAYLANIAQQGAVVEAQLRDGNWRATQMPAGILRWDYWGGGETLLEPVSPIVRWVRAWDLASTKPRKGYRDPDYTVGVLMGWDAFERWYVADVVLCRAEVDGVDELLARTASADGPDVLQVIEVEGGASGKRDAKTTRSVLQASGRCGPIREVRAVKDKATKARPMANELRLGMFGNRPRVTSDDKKPWSHRGFLLNIGGPEKGWMNRPYADDGNHLPTVGKIFWQQVRPFPLTVDQVTGKKIHDDIPDAMAIAHNAGRPVETVAPRPATRWDRLS